MEMRACLKVVNVRVELPAVAAVFVVDVAVAAAVAAALAGANHVVVQA